MKVQVSSVRRRLPFFAAYRIVFINYSSGAIEGHVIIKEKEPVEE